LVGLLLNVVVAVAKPIIKPLEEEKEIKE